MRFDITSPREPIVAEVDRPNDVTGAYIVPSPHCFPPRGAQDYFPRCKSEGSAHLHSVPSTFGGLEGVDPYPCLSASFLPAIGVIWLFFLFYHVKAAPIGPRPPHYRGFVITLHSL